MQGRLHIREGHRAPVPDASPDQQLLLPGDWEKLQAVKASERFLLPVGTSWVERDVYSISDEINARWPNLRVASCSCGNCLAQGHYPHVVMEYGRDGRTHPVFGFVEFGRHVIERLHAIHVSNLNVDAHQRLNREQRRKVKKKSQEKAEERLEVVEAALRSHKHSWKGPDGMKTDPRARIAK